MMKKIIDEKGRLFGKISIVDILVIIIAVVLVAAVYVKFHSNERTSTLKDLETVTYVYSIEGVREGVPASIKVGDGLYDQENDVCLGKITDMQVEEATKPVQLTDGTYVDGPVQDRYDVLLTVEAQCQIMNGRMYADSIDEINVNGEKKAYTKYAMFVGTITEIK